MRGRFFALVYSLNLYETNNGRFFSIREDFNVTWNTDELIPTIEGDILVLYKDNKGEIHTEVQNVGSDLDILDFDKELQWESYCEHIGYPLIWCFLDDILRHIKE